MLANALLGRGIEAERSAAVRVGLEVFLLVSTLASWCAEACENDLRDGGVSVNTGERNGAVLSGGAA